MSVSNDYSLPEFDAKNDLKQGSVNNKQAWLKLLERDGLSDALAQFQVIKDSKTIKNSDSTKNNTQKIITPVKSNIPSDGERLTSKTDVMLQKIQIKKNTLAANRPNVHQPDLINDTLAVVSMESKPENVSIKMQSKEMGVIKSSPDFMRYLNQNMVFSKAVQGVELWVRDVNLSSAKLMSMLKDVKATMGLLGVSLVKVTLNGQEVFSKKQSQTIVKNKRSF